MSTFHERYLAEIAAQPVQHFATRQEAEAALNEAGIKVRDCGLFMEPAGSRFGWLVRLEQARTHVLNVNSPLNVNHVPGVHRRGSEVKS